MEGAGWVERVRIVGDGRLRHVQLTPRGDQVWADMLGSIQSRYDDALIDFSTGECVLLFRLLDRLRDSLGRMTGAETV
jgi:DNA-binding MarR family transcriptional regulator